MGVVGNLGKAITKTAKGLAEAKALRAAANVTNAQAKAIKTAAKAGKIEAKMKKSAAKRIAEVTAGAAVKSYAANQASRVEIARINADARKAELARWNAIIQGNPEPADGTDAPTPGKTTGPKVVGN